jgi:hypothetical protein
VLEQDYADDIDAPLLSRPSSSKEKSKINAISILSVSGEKTTDALPGTIVASAPKECRFCTFNMRKTAGIFVTK